MLVLDTDGLSVYLDEDASLHGRVRARLARADGGPAVVTAVSIQEVMRGRLAAVNAERRPGDIVEAYRLLVLTFERLKTVQALPFGAAAQTRFEQFRHEKLRTPTLDLRIACVALVHNVTVLTRNLSDFRPVPGLHVEDWAASL